MPRDSVSWAGGAVFNPGIWYDGSAVHMLFRAIPAGYETIGVDHFVAGEADMGFDHYISSIGYARSSDGEYFEWADRPLIEPDAPFDCYGAEDPRVTRIDDIYFVTYTALSHPAFGETDGVRIGLASTLDFTTIRKYGVIGPTIRDKDAVLFPRRIGGKIVMLHRLGADIQRVLFNDVNQLVNPPAELWEKHITSIDEHVVMRPRTGWEEKKIGAGPPPIETDFGWLLIYHGVDRHHVYRAGLALLDLDDPRRVIARTSTPVLSPEMPFELRGDVENVVFPEGAAVIDHVLHLYYGAADKVIGLARAPLNDILSHLLV